MASILFLGYSNLVKGRILPILKQAGFTMALTGGNNKVTRGVDKYKVPRYVVYNTTSVNNLANMIN